MASFTSFLNLLKKNPATDGKDTFNIETMLNENWDKIDLKVEENSSAIGQIATDRGYKSSKQFNTIQDFNNLTLNGKYALAFLIHNNAPVNGVEGSYILDVTAGWGQAHIVQKAYCTSGMGIETKSFERRCVNGDWSAWKEIATTDKFTATSQSLVIGAGFEAQTGASPFQVTKSGTVLHFIGQVKCITANVAQPVVLAISPVKPLTYYGLNVTINGTLSNTLTIDPTTGNLYVYRNFVIGDIINFNGFAMGVL